MDCSFFVISSEFTSLNLLVLNDIPRLFRDNLNKIAFRGLFYGDEKSCCNWRKWLCRS